MHSQCKSMLNNGRPGVSFPHLSHDLTASDVPDRLRQFFRQLWGSPAGYTTVNLPCMLQDLEAAVSEAFPAASEQQRGPASQPPAPAPVEAAGKLWNKDAELAEARERAEWHEVMSRRQTDVSEKLQVRRFPCEASAQADTQQQSTPDHSWLAGKRLHAHCSAAGPCAAAP